ncbi:MAG: hypothetical protein AAGN35_01760 [Bacteroidota bacterium]
MGTGKFSPQVKAALPGLLVAGLHLLALGFPEQLWGFHYVTYLPEGVNLAILLLGIGLCALPLTGRALPVPTLPNAGRLPLIALTAVGFSVLFSQLPIASHCYGDAQFIYRNVNGPVDAWNPDMVYEIIRPSFTDIKTGVGAYYALVSLIAYQAGVLASQAALWVATAMGIVWVIVWQLLIGELFPKGGLRLTFSLLGLTAPFLQVYFGHYEVYSLPLSLGLAYLAALVMTFRTGSRRWFFLALPLLYLAMKFQFANLILAPSAILAGLYVFRGPENATQIFTWKKLAILVLLPIYTLGGLFYLFVTKSAFGPRSFGQDTIDQVVFLPIRAFEEAPLDRYNLLSFAHISDYFNLLFLWSAPALAFLGIGAGLRPKGLTWRSPLTITLGTTLLLYFAAFFVFNPLMSMAMDWDLMSIPGPALLVFTAVLWHQVDAGEWTGKLLPPVIGLGLFAVAGWWVNGQPDLLTHRLEATGYRGFKTYRIGMSTTFEQALELEADSSQIPLRRETYLTALEPHTVKGRDAEYAALLVGQGEWYENAARDLGRGVEYYERAVTYDPKLGTAVYRAVIGNFLLRRFARATEFLPQLVKIRYPDGRKSLRIAIHTSLEATQYPQAQAYAQTYNARFPGDTMIEDIERDLAAGRDLDQLKFRFSRGN